MIPLETEPQLSQLITSQQSFLRRENREKPRFFSQQTGSQQLDCTEATEPQQLAGWQAGAGQGGAQGVVQAGSQLVTSQQSLLRRNQLRRGLQTGSQQLTAQSLTAPHVPPQLLVALQAQEEAGAACATGAAATGLDPALTVVSSRKKTFTWVILRLATGHRQPLASLDRTFLPEEVAGGTFPILSMGQPVTGRPRLPCRCYLGSTTRSHRLERLRLFMSPT